MLQSVADIQTAAAQCRAVALAGLIARAEKLHQQRTAAVAAAVDWLSGDLPADEVPSGCQRPAPDVFRCPSTFDCRGLGSCSVERMLLIRSPHVLQQNAFR